MISRDYVVFAFSAAVLSACLSAQVSAKSAPKISLQAIYNSRDAAFENENSAGALAPYAADVIIINTDGTQSRGVAAQREELGKLFTSGIALSAPDTELEEFTLDKAGHEATVKAVRHLTVTSKSAVLGVLPSTVVEETVRDHWVEGKDGWHITQERRLTPSTLLALCSDAAAGPTSNKIVGKWVGYIPSSTGVQALMTMRFRENGMEAETVVSSRQNISQESTYIADNNVLTETLTRGMENGQALHNAGDVKTIRYRFDNGQLLLIMPGTTTELHFARQPE